MREASNMKIKICPKCKKSYSGRSTTSVADNYTRICLNCAKSEFIVSLAKEIKTKSSQKVAEK